MSNANILHSRIQFAYISFPIIAGLNSFINASISGEGFSKIVLISSAISFLYQDSEAICDDEYYEEVMQIIRELEDVENVLNEEKSNLS